MGFVDWGKCERAGCPRIAQVARVAVQAARRDGIPRRKITECQYHAIGIDRLAVAKLQRRGRAGE
jgi:hypothetical protein